MSSIREAVLIDIDKLHPNPWNPNEEKAATFDKLVEEIKEDGFKDPLTVVPLKEDHELWQKGWTGEHYLIIAGEHRYKGAALLDYPSLPCYVEEDWDEDLQKLKTVRNNLLRGDLNSTKFTALVKQLGDTFDAHELPDLLGFNDPKDMQRYIIDERDKKEKTFLDGLVDESRKEKHAIDSLTDIVADIFSATVDTVDQNYLFFTHKGKLHMAVSCDASTFREVQNMVNRLEESGELATDFIREAIKNHLA